ncbi:MAG TPA: glycosyltransferase family 4 protein [Gaiellaceae bacterium]|nr:glycosyltransferase family 4 protein [Gaiellaceae bacterium]
MKVGIVVPFSWSYVGGVGEHAESQAEALGAAGVETRLITGDDPPGGLSRLFHPDAGRADRRPSRVISAGTTVTVPANASRTHIVLNQLADLRMLRLLRRERFDLLHLHEPMTPALCVSALAHARSPVVGTWHATGELGWMKVGLPLWGCLMKRIDYRIAVSEVARDSAARYLPGPFEIIPNGIAIPPHADPGGRDDVVVYVGRHDPRKGLEVLLRAWPEIRRRTDATLSVVGADPRAVRLLLARQRLSADGVELRGVVVGEPLTRLLSRAKLLVAPSLGQESFGMVLTRAFACATPVVASSIPGYDGVMSPDVGLSVPPGDAAALGDAVVELLSDEPRRQRLGAAARARAVERYSWTTLARRLLEIYTAVLAGEVGKRADRQRH